MLRSIGSLLSIVLAIVTLIAARAPALASETVFPTGVFPDDVEHVQAALDAGGVVLLKGENAAGEPLAFDFGPAQPGIGGSTWITKDVVIVGERGESGRTTIRGGSVPFRGDTPVRLGVLNVEFDGPLEAALVLTASAGAVIVGNEISGVVGAPFFDATSGDGMAFIGGDPSVFSGHILVSANVIHDLLAEDADGLDFESVAAAVTIAFNRIEAVGTNGILMFQAGGDVAILGNVIVPGPGSGSPYSTGNGIQLLGTAGGVYRIEHNTVICENALADGLLMAGGVNWLTFEPGPPILGAVIDDNEISIANTCCGAISLFDDVSFSTIRRNRLHGTGVYALGLVPTGLVASPRAVGNFFSGNAISQFTPDLAHVLFFSHARNNLFIGPSGIVVDLGENNRFLPPGPH